MGIREEIAFLMCTSKSLGKYSDAIDDVLSILDEHLGELVGEAEWLDVYDQDQLEDGRDWILLEMNMPEEFLEGIHKVRPGDHISIYVRRKKK